MLLLVTLLTVKVCLAQIPTLPPSPQTSGYSSFSNILQQYGTNQSNTDLQIVNQKNTLSPTGVPLVTPTTESTSPATPQGGIISNETGLPDLTMPSINNPGNSSSSEQTTQPTRQQLEIDSLQTLKDHRDKENGQEPTSQKPSSKPQQKQEQKSEQKSQKKPEQNSEESTHNPSDIHNQDKYENINPQYGPGDVYGKDFFEKSTLQVFNKSSDAVAPDNYILGVGDKISVSVWGYSSYDAAFVIDETGAITPTETGRIYLKGISFKDAKQIMAKKFGEVFDLHNSQIDFALVYSRDITVNIVGEVIAPGSYHIPAVNTAFNALIAAHGPNRIGSVRNIFIKRDGKTIKTLDVYQFLQNPNSTEDFFVQDNDYIFVTAAKKIVQITGEVGRPMSYELLDNENLFDLIKYAGGLKANAYTQSIQITRFQNSHAEIIDINLDSLTKINSDYNLVNGDKIVIDKLPEQLLTYVAISGPVKIPGQYEFNKGMKVSDLLSKSQGVTEEAYLDFGYVVRTLPDLTKQYIPFVPKNVIDDAKSADNLVLQNQDIVDIFKKENFANTLTVTINGAVHTPGSYIYGQGLTLRDLLFYAGGLLPTAANNRIEVSRVMSSNNGNPPYTATPAIVKIVTIGSDLTLDQSASTFQLQPYDIIFVRQAPSFSRQTTVTLTGEVIYPGRYTILNKGEKIASLINRAGGPTAWAYLENTTLKRSEDSVGYVISNLKKALKDSTSRFNVLVKPGDSIVVPTVNDLVSITGAVNYPFLDPLKKVSVPYHKGWSAKHYIKVYGDGFAKDAWRTHSYVIQPGGYVQSVHRFLVFNAFPHVKKGGGVYVEYKQKAINTSAPSPPVNWGDIIKDTTAKITGILTLYVIIDKLLLP